jgi:hypothetical protein
MACCSDMTSVQPEVSFQPARSLPSLALHAPSAPGTPPIQPLLGSIPSFPGGSNTSPAQQARPLPVHISPSKHPYPNASDSKTARGLRVLFSISRQTDGMRRWTRPHSVRVPAHGSIRAYIRAAASPFLESQPKPHGRGTRPSSLQPAQPSLPSLLATIFESKRACAAPGNRSRLLCMLFVRDCCDAGAGGTR